MKPIQSKTKTRTKAGRTASLRCDAVVRRLRGLKAAQLIADSEARATERLRKEIDWLQLNNDMLTDNPVGHARAVKERADLIAERDQLRAELAEVRQAHAKERARLDWLMNKSFIVMPSATDFSSPMLYAVHVYTPDGDLKQQYPSADTERAAIDAAMKEDGT